MSDPCVDLEKGITGLKEEEEKKGITGLKEEEEKKGITGLKEEKVVYQFKHLKVMCVKRLLDVAPLLYFMGVMYMALCLHRLYHVWWPALFLLTLAILNFWNYRRMKHGYIQQTLASDDGDLSTTLLASSSKK